jgi:hypothetical protein
MKRAGKWRLEGEAPIRHWQGPLLTVKTNLAVPRVMQKGVGGSQDQPEGVQSSIFAQTIRRVR